MTDFEHPVHPLNVAVVGAGPAGFYATAQLLGGKAIQGQVRVDVFDRLPTPYGLVRFGVAPDHPKIKSVTRVYDKVARLPGFRYFGGVEVGKDIEHLELMARYSAVIYTTGAPHDRRLGIPGEDLPGSVAATEFVAWYNGHPDARDFTFDLTSRRAVVIGNGNVAVDVARMLALTATELRVTDTADHAIEALSNSEIEEIIILGRRGLAQAAFTNPELRELGELEDADIIVDPSEVALDDGSKAWLNRDGGDVREQNNVDIATEYSTRVPTGKRRRVVLRFLSSPVRIIGTEKIEAIEVVKNELVAEADGRLSARPTADTEIIECGLVLRSVGYRGRSLPGVPFDEQRATIRNVDGRVISESGEPVPGLYTGGWIKRGPSGIIGTNKKCANETVAALAADHAEGRLLAPMVEGDIADLVAERISTHVDYAGWQRIDAHEVGLGVPLGRPRVKLTDTDEMFRVAHAVEDPDRESAVHR